MSVRCASNSKATGSLPVGDASGGKNQNPLLVLFDAIARRFRLWGAGFGNRFVHSSHFEYAATSRLLSIIGKTCRNSGDGCFTGQARLCDAARQFSKKIWSAGFDKNSKSGDKTKWGCLVGP